VYHYYICCLRSIIVFAAFCQLKVNDYCCIWCR